eukprot:gene9079-16203_t
MTAPGMTKELDGLKSYPLGESFWVDELPEDDDDEFTFPDVMWAVLTGLCQNTGPESSLASRLTIGDQVAHTAYSSVFTAILNGKDEEGKEETTEVVLKEDGEEETTEVVLKRMEFKDLDNDCEALQLSNVFAEVSILEHLKKWEGCVKLIEFNRSGNTVMLVLERCQKDPHQWEAKPKLFVFESLQVMLVLERCQKDLHQWEAKPRLFVFESLQVMLVLERCQKDLHQWEAKPRLFVFESLQVMLVLERCQKDLHQWESKPKLFVFASLQVMLVLERCQKDLHQWEAEQTNKTGLSWFNVVLQRFLECYKLVARLHSCLPTNTPSLWRQGITADLLAVLSPTRASTGATSQGRLLSLQEAECEDTCNQIVELLEFILSSALHRPSARAVAARVAMVQG